MPTIAHRIYYVFIGLILGLLASHELVVMPMLEALTK